MENSVLANEGHENRTMTRFPPSTSVKAVSYSCGSCGYELNLHSSNRNTSSIGSKYSKSIKRGILSFCSVDESRFTLVDELQCIPYISARRPWAFFRRRTRLLCRKCGNNIGVVYLNSNSTKFLLSDGQDLPSPVEASGTRQYEVRIRALQPSSSEEQNMSLFLS